MVDAPPLEIRLLAAEEATELVACIRRCYGETYIDPGFYDEAKVRALIAEGVLRSIGAWSERGELVGHMAITRRAGASTSADAGMTLVDPEWRGMGIAHKVAAGLGRQCVALGLAGVHDYPVTVHAATQRLGGGIGVETGLMLANVPADVAFRAMDDVVSGRRSSSIIRWLPSGEAPVRTVHLPDRYSSRIESLYGEACLERRSVAGVGLASAVSQIEAEYDRRRALIRVRVLTAGEDVAARVTTAVDAAVGQGALVAHVDLPLGSASTPAATAALNHAGYAFAGLLPEYRDDDVLRLQWLAGPVEDLDSIVLEGEATQAIGGFVLEDWRELADALDPPEG